MEKYLSVNFNLRKLTKDALIYMGKKLIRAGKGYAEVLELVDERLHGEIIPHYGDWLGNGNLDLTKLEDASLVGRIVGESRRYCECIDIDKYRKYLKLKFMYTGLHIVNETNQLDFSSFQQLSRHVSRSVWSNKTSGTIEIYRNSYLERRNYKVIHKGMESIGAGLIECILDQFTFLRKLGGGD